MARRPVWTPTREDYIELSIGKDQRPTELQEIIVFGRHLRGVIGFLDGVWIRNFARTTFGPFDPNENNAEFTF